MAVLIKEESLDFNNDIVTDCNGLLLLLFTAPVIVAVFWANKFPVIDARKIVVITLKLLIRFLS
jgi:hypothetical protein